MSKNFVIRINNPQSIEASDDYDVTEETSIRWDRVISVSIAALLLLALLISGFWYFFTAETMTHEPPLFVEATPEKVSDETAPLVKKEQENLRVLAKVEPEVKVPDVPPPAKTDAASLKKAAENAVTPVKVTAAPTPSIAPAFVDPIEIKSNRIVKAQLTHTVNKNEPVGRLGDSVSMKGDKLIKVYLFTGLKGLKGETLYHDWYLSGKKMARVKINVRSNETSASSSKFIDQYMTGDWRVKVSTSRGDELVSANFNVSH
ncbi:DUF2914 domain-containing protein [Alkalimarinus alittae]|uniref:DUF2914 domain-containing protein n=1 Tax=Alkalimarinus alittae TaxID=2961619 RepID=A0ABY6N3A1_9ALTE|nr:DUF2914 domain-containing protein [Alkalimarinus alittae]UZE96593.1 DUF2914 domain-containing protein [Alkalimarinus alittae]